MLGKPSSIDAVWNDLWVFTITEKNGEQEYDEECYLLARNGLEACNIARAFAKDWYMDVEAVCNREKPTVVSYWETPGGPSWFISKWPRRAREITLRPINGGTYRVYPR